MTSSRRRCIPFRPRGTRAPLGLPGSGVSYSTTIPNDKKVVGKIRVRNCHSEFLTSQIKNLRCGNVLLRTNMPGLL
jgi:hypothetical protein